MGNRILVITPKKSSRNSATEGLGRHGYLYSDAINNVTKSNLLSAEAEYVGISRKNWFWFPLLVSQFRSIIFVKEFIVLPSEVESISLLGTSRRESFMNGRKGEDHQPIRSPFHIQKRTLERNAGKESC
jgi:hypothetical protein